MNSSTPKRNSFQLFADSEEAQTLKQAVKKRFAPKFIFRLQQSSPHTDRQDGRLPHSCEAEHWGFSLLQNNFTVQTQPKPLILKKRALLAHRLTVGLSDKFRKDIQRSRQETETIGRKMRGTHIPLRGNSQISIRKWSKQNTCHSTTIDTDSRKLMPRMNVLFG